MPFTIARQAFFIRFWRLFPAICCSYTYRCFSNWIRSSLNASTICSLSAAQIIYGSSTCTSAFSSLLNRCTGTSAAFPSSGISNVIRPLPNNWSIPCWIKGTFIGIEEVISLHNDKICCSRSTSTWFRVLELLLKNHQRITTSTNPTMTTDSTRVICREPASNEI